MFIDMAEGNSSDLSDSGDYVNSVMSSRNVLKCATPRTGRKRTLSANDLVLSELIGKKQCQEKNNTTGLCDIEPIEAKRSLYSGSNDQLHKGKGTNHDNAVGHVSQLIEKLLDDVSALSDRLNGRIDRLKTTLESRFSQKVAIY